MKKDILAKCINIIFHPILMPTIFAVVIYYSTIFSGLFTNSKSMMTLLPFITLTTVMIPLLCYFILSKTKFYAELKKQNYKWDSLFIICEAVILCAIYKTFFNIDVPTIIYRFFILNSIFLVILSLISFFKKIDLHSIAWGELLGIYINLLHTNMTIKEAPLLIILLIIGVVGWARIKTDNSMTLKYIVGTIIGCLFTMATF